MKTFLRSSLMHFENEFLVLFLLAILLSRVTSEEQQSTYPEGVHQLVVEKLNKIRGDPSRKFGTWGEWSEWTPCSRTCGTGVSTQSRDCRSTPFSKRKRITRLKPIKEKSRCVGRYKRFQLCNTQGCPGGYKDFRKEQCESYNKTPFDKKFYTWEPYIDGADSCSLNCRAIGLSFYATLNQSVVDGTPCGAFHPLNRVHNRICVGGKCLLVGCDGVLGSGRVVDACGQCGGDNSTCRIISGVYSRSRLPFGYNLIASLPPKAENVSIYHVSPSSNYLALRELGGSYLLNGPWGVNSSGSFPAAGTVFTYVRPQPFQGDYLYASGPLSHSVDVMLFYQSTNPGIKYEYRMPLLTSQGGPRTTDNGFNNPHGRYSFAAQRSPPIITATHSGTVAIPRLQSFAKQDSPEYKRYSRPLHRLPSATYGGEESFSLLSDDPYRVPFNTSNKFLMPPRFPNEVQAPFLPSKAAPNGTYLGSLPYSLYNGVGPSSPDRRIHPNIYEGFTTSDKGHLGKKYGNYSPKDHFRNNYNEIPTSNSKLSAIGGKHLHRKLSSSSDPFYNSVLYSQQPFYNSLAKPTKPPASGSLIPQRRTYALPHHLHGNKLPSKLSFTPPATSSVFPSKSKPGPINDESINAARNLGSVGTAGTVASSRHKNRKRHKKNDSPQTGGSKRKSRRKKYIWIPKGFTQCNQTCGGGFKTTRYICVKKKSKDKEVPTHFCAEFVLPKVERIPCNLKPCPPKWQADDWGPCSVSCGLGVQLRRLKCQKMLTNGKYLELADEDCDTASPLPRAQVCQMSDCDGPPKWEIGPWTTCSKLCGIGIRTRKVHCSSAHGVLPDASCPYAKPSTEQMCDMGSCASDTWFFSSWDTRCYGPCGEGVQRRRVHCSGNTLGNFSEASSCPRKGKPSETRSCEVTLECDGSWFTGPWSECDAHCGSGLQRRAVVCVFWSRNKYKVTDDSKCKASGQRPSDTQPCSIECKAEWFTSEWSQCSVSCGDGGVQRREVKCLGVDMRPSLACLSATKPDSRQQCNTQSCDKSNYQFLDRSRTSYVSKTNKKPTRSHGNDEDDDVTLNESSEGFNKITSSFKLDGNAKGFRRIIPGPPWKSDLCIDRMKNCNLVYKARLCKLKYYNKLCCETCKKHDS